MEKDYEGADLDLELYSLISISTFIIINSFNKELIQSFWENCKNYLKFYKEKYDHNFVILPADNWHNVSWSTKTLAYIVEIHGISDFR